METTTGSGHIAIPLVVSEHEKLTVRLVLFHPAALGGGFTEATICGGTVSIPINSIVIPLPALPRSSTVNVLSFSSGARRTMNGNS